MTPPPSPPPFRRVGSQLGFAVELKKRGQWPPKPRSSDNKVPTATAYLVVPSVAGDTGARPAQIGAGHAVGVEILDAAGGVVQTPAAGQSYRLRATIVNLGATASYAGLANFFVDTRADFKVDRANQTGPPAQGRTGFMVRSHATVVVESPNLWTPADATEAAKAVLVQAYDLVLDPLGSPFDWFGNRHVALW